MTDLLTGLQEAKLEAYNLPYDLTISTPRLPQYILGQRVPLKVELVYPLEITCTLVYEPDTYIPKRLLDFPCDPTVKNII